MKYFLLGGCVASSIISAGEQLRSDKKRLMDDQAYQEGPQQRQKIRCQENIHTQPINQPNIVQTFVLQQPFRSTFLSRLPTQTVARQVAMANEVSFKISSINRRNLLRRRKRSRNRNTFHTHASVYTVSA